MNDIETSPHLTEEQVFCLRRIREALELIWLGSGTESVIYAAQAELLSNWDDNQD